MNVEYAQNIYNLPMNGSKLYKCNETNIYYYSSSRSYHPEEKACRSNIRKGNTEGTRANHRTHYNSYVKFCEEYRYPPFPADDWRYCLFAQYLESQGKKPGTVDNYVSTVRVLHKLQNYYSPQPGQIHYKMLSQSFKKQRKEPIRQAVPITHQLLLKIFEKVQVWVELEAVAWTAVLVGFSMVLRISNLGPRTRDKFDPANNFVRNDLAEKDGILSLGVRWSKTRQLRNKTIWGPLLPSSDKRICTKHWVTRMVKNIPEEKHEPLFLVREGAHRFPTTGPQICRLLTKWCEQSGLDPKLFTSHCLRRGGLNWGH